MSRLEIDFDFEYCFENFSFLCRFCCRLKSNDADLRVILDDSSEERLNESTELIGKIHYTLYDNVSGREFKPCVVLKMTFFLDSRKS